MKQTSRLTGLWCNIRLLSEIFTVTKKCSKALFMQLLACHTAVLLSPTVGIFYGQETNSAGSEAYGGAVRIEEGSNFVV